MEETIKQLTKEIEEAKSMKYRNCLVCEKQYSLRQSDTKRYCSRKCSDIAMRVRDWENKRGMNLRVLKAKLKTLKEVSKKIKKVGKEWEVVEESGSMSGKFNYIQFKESAVFKELLKKFQGEK